MKSEKSAYVDQKVVSPSRQTYSASRVEASTSQAAPGSSAQAADSFQRVGISMLRGIKQGIEASTSAARWFESKIDPNKDAVIMLKRLMNKALKLELAGQVDDVREIIQQVAETANLRNIPPSRFLTQYPPFLAVAGLKGDSQTVGLAIDLGFCDKVPYWDAAQILSSKALAAYPAVARTVYNTAMSAMSEFKETGYSRQEELHRAIYGTKDSDYIRSFLGTSLFRHANEALKLGMPDFAATMLQQTVSSTNPRPVAEAWNDAPPEYRENSSGDAAD